MKSTHYSTLILFAGWLFACTPNNTKEQHQIENAPTLEGYWNLEKEEQSNGKEVNFHQKASTVILNFQKTGYFLIYDSLIHVPKTGIAKIAVRHKGQWKVDQPIITLMHVEGDTNYTETFAIEQLTNDQLIYSKQTASGKKKFTFSRKKK